VLINGFNHLACKTLVRDVGTRITVEALPSLRVLKDLIVDMEPFFDQYRSILPYLVNDEPVADTERLQSRAERARFDDTTKCILCAACTSSFRCSWATSGTSGRRQSSWRTASSSTRVTARPLSGSRCSTTTRAPAAAGRCSTARDCCPRGIKVTQAITDVKRALLFDDV